jgi:hypothetical protein
MGPRFTSFLSVLLIGYGMAVSLFHMRRMADSNRGYSQWKPLATVLSFCLAISLITFLPAIATSDLIWLSLLVIAVGLSQLGFSLFYFRPISQQRRMCGLDDPRSSTWRLLLYAGVVTLLLGVMIRMLQT